MVMVMVKLTLTMGFRLRKRERQHVRVDHPSANQSVVTQCTLRRKQRQHLRLLLKYLRQLPLYIFCKRSELNKLASSSCSCRFFFLSFNPVLCARLTHNHTRCARA